MPKNKNVPRWSAPWWDPAGVTSFSGLPAGAQNLRLRVGWFYELMSRHRGEYLLQADFVSIRAAAQGFLCDQLAETLPGTNSFASPVVGFEEVRAATMSGWGAEDVAADRWSEPLCLNLARGNEEIVEAIKARLAEYRPNPGASVLKSPSWAWVSALQAYSDPKFKLKNTLPKGTKFRAERFIQEWNKKNPGLLDDVLGNWKRLSRKQ